MIREKESGKPLADLLVCVYDKDLFRSDFLGKSLTGADGKFLIEYDSSDFQEGLDKNPDIYLEVYRKSDAKMMDSKKVRPVYSTKKSIRHGSSSSEKYYIEISRNKLK